MAVAWCAVDAHGISAAAARSALHYVARKQIQTMQHLSHKPHSSYWHPQSSGGVSAQSTGSTLTGMRDDRPLAIGPWPGLVLLCNVLYCSACSSCASAGNPFYCACFLERTWRLSTRLDSIPTLTHSDEWRVRSCQPLRCQASRREGANIRPQPVTNLQPAQLSSMQPADA